jgi:anti-sigma regulatory factor (Ser/Thr protein kinase)
MYSDGNRLFFVGSVSGEFLPTTAAVHNLIKKQGYRDVVLDFRRSTFLSAEFMVPFVTTCRAHRQDKVDFELLMPDDSRSAALMSNTNWAHLISPEQFEPKDENNIRHLSARQYFTSDEHHRAVDDSLETILKSISGIDRSRLKALEWALTEITDNVLNHAESPVGGIMQVMTFPKRRRAEFFVCDAGITIARSLRSGRPDIRDDTSALRAAIEEGVTRNAKTNQGNGLFGTFKCCEVSGGEFDVISGAVSLRHRPGQLTVERTTIPYEGTYVRASIGYDYDRLLEDALVFRGRAHDPSYDYVERAYKLEGEHVSFSVKNELRAFGSREAGQLARTKVENLMDRYRTPVEFDFSGIKLISSSFADEVFGKLFGELGPIRFGQLCRFKNVDSTVQGLIDRAISQRLRGS